MSASYTGFGLEHEAAGRGDVGDSVEGTLVVGLEVDRAAAWAARRRDSGPIVASASCATSLTSSR
jgi:hypothetical protein